MMQRICLVIVLLFTLSISANAQGTPGTLRCNLRGGLEIHGSRDPGSSLIGRVQCGDPVLIIDQRFGSPHIRTEDGKDGYIIGLNLGQWSLEPEAQQLLNNAPPPNVVQPTATAPTAIIIRTPRAQTIPDGNKGTTETLNGLRRTELFYAALSYLRQNGMNLYGGDLALTFNVNPLFGIVADLGVYRSETFETVLGNGRNDAITYRFGPKFSVRPNERITLFGQILVGGSRARETDDLGDLQVSYPYVNGFVFHPSGGLDIALARWVGLRLEPGYNFHRILSENSNGFQIAVGPVFRFAPR